MHLCGLVVDPTAQLLTKLLHVASTLAGPKGVLKILVERKAVQRVAKIKLGLDGPHSSPELVRGRRSEIGKRMVCIG
jgi:hypothetical protein